MSWELQCTIWRESCYSLLRRRNSWSRYIFVSSDVHVSDYRTELWLICLRKVGLAYFVNKLSASWNWKIHNRVHEISPLNPMRNKFNADGTHLISASFLFLSCPGITQWIWAHDVPFSRYQGLCRGKNGYSAKLTTCAQLVPRLGMQGHSRASCTKRV